MQLSSASASMSKAESTESSPEIMEESFTDAIVAQEAPIEASPGEKKGDRTRLEGLKAIIECIRSNINRNATIPQKTIAFNGTSTAEKINNLAKEALKKLLESQELPPKALRILTSADEEGLEGYEMMESFRTVATIAASENIEVNRRLASLNKNGVENNEAILNNKVRPKVLRLMKQVHNDEVFCSDEMVNFAVKMEPAEVDAISRSELAELESGVGWIISKIWGKTAANIWTMMLSKCPPKLDNNDRTCERVIILTHIWNLRFKTILKLNPRDRTLHNATERELCKTISQAIHGQILQTLSNTRCINEELLTNAARTAKTHLDAIFSKINPLSAILQEFLANADANEAFTNWEAILLLRKLWPERTTMPENEARILNLSAIDDRIQLGLCNPDSLLGTTYVKLFKKKTAYGSRKRKWNPAENEWGQNMEGNRSGYEERSGEGQL